MSGARTGSKPARRARRPSVWLLCALLFSALICALGALYRLGLSAAAEQDVVLLRSYGGDAETAVIRIRTLRQAEEDAQQAAALPASERAARQQAAESQAAARRVDALAEQNPDCIGWLTLAGAGVDYPLMYSPGRRDYYIDRSFDGDKSRSGLPFLDERCTPDGMHRIVYGHNMKDGTLFGSLDRLLDADFYAQNRDLYVDSDTGRTRYTVCSVFLTEVDERAAFRFYAYADLSEAADYEAYIEGVLARNVHENDLAPTFGTRIVTLVTCSNHAAEGRLVVVAADSGAGG